jgi:hypothetical protein
MRFSSTIVTLRFLALVSCASVAAGCASSDPAPAPPPTTIVESSSPTSAAALATTTATVEAVDQKTRKVTLRTAEGERVSFVAGDDVRNLAQVRKGDLVTVSYYESIALSLRSAEGEKPSVKVAEATERAALGQKPAGTVVRETTLTAKVLKIDRATRHVTLEGPEGNAVTLKVDQSIPLDNVKVGKLVEARFKEAVAITVTKPE